MSISVLLVPRVSEILVVPMLMGFEGKECWKDSHSNWRVLWEGEPSSGDTKGVLYSSAMAALVGFLPLTVALLVVGLLLEAMGVSFSDFLVDAVAGFPTAVLAYNGLLYFLAGSRSHHWTWKYAHSSISEILLFMLTLLFAYLFNQPN